MQALPTIKVFDKNQGALIINERDFNATTQETWEDYESRLRREKLEAEARAAEAKVREEKAVPAPVRKSIPAPTKSTDVKESVE